MATLTVQEVARTGLAPSYVAAAGGGDAIPNDGRTMLHIKNGGGSSITLTVVTQATVLGNAVADDAIAVPNGGERMVGPFPPSIYNDVNQLVQLTYSGVTTVTVAAIRVP
ncbi:MAG TPA: hypothetical protein PLC98_05145 [Anaerolineales bacterium]|nr:hypothetical protein [Anaerolineales bacterium]